MGVDESLCYSFMLMHMEGSGLSSRRAGRTGSVRGSAAVSLTQDNVDSWGEAIAVLKCRLIGRWSTGGPGPVYGSTPITQSRLNGLLARLCSPSITNIAVDGALAIECFSCRTAVKPKGREKGEGREMK
ncbi:hypothetical protein BHE74_00055658 [Ensete ventricosum]|nr:hypothetical protein BHE74_00055658 [Ensete ventricosum]